MTEKLSGSTTMTSYSRTGQTGLRSGSSDNNPRRRRNHGRPGFSLLELVIVIAIIAVLMVVVSLKLANVQPQRDRLAADELAMHLRYGQQLALSRECNVKVIFSTVSNQYSIWIETNVGSYAYAKDPVTQSNLAVIVDDRFEGVKLNTVSVNIDPALYFNKTNGIPCGTDNVQLTATGTVAFLSGKMVTVTPLTGYVQVQ